MVDRDVNGYEISAYSRILNPLGADSGLGFVPAGMDASTTLNPTGIL